MATATSLPSRPFVVTSDIPLSAVDLAALDVASRPLAKRRSEIAVGTHPVWLRCLIHGSIAYGAPVDAHTPADVLGVLAWILARLPDRSRAAVAAEIAGGAVEVTDEQREAAKAFCAPTRGLTVRSGSITGALSVERIG